MPERVAAEMSDLVMAVDVGTASARAGVFFARDGVLLGHGTSPIVMNKPEADHVEHDSEDIWRAVCVAARDARAAAGVAAETIGGIAFDATCSLVVRDGEGRQQSVSTTGRSRWDTIAWLDHRALDEADECTATKHPVLEFLGGVMSPEMQIPKLMWLKRRFPERWERIGHVFDLADFLTWRASGSEQRSHCTLASKWTYLGHEAQGWQMDFLASIGLDDMLARGRLPAESSPVGHDLGPLTGVAAHDIGLTTECRVGTGMIDAHAGALGLLGGPVADDPSTIHRQAALIAGTSSSVMAFSPEPWPTHGIWGPFYSVSLPGLWLVDAGQSATGALLDHLIRHHGAGGEPTPAMHERIAERIGALRAIEGDGFAAGLHVLPDFHGNRSPLADPRAVGVVSGLDLDASFDSLCRLYWRTALGIALGIRHIVETLNGSTHAIDRLHVTGGHTRNPILMELYREAIGCTLIERSRDHGVLSGTAAVAATASGLHPDLRCAAAAMGGKGDERKTRPTTTNRYDCDYRIFRAMHDQRKDLDALS